MKAEDLMIGDWVLYKSDSLENAFPIQITREMFNKELVVWKDRFEPIPLTPEILKKNGILYRKSSFYYIINDDKDLECTHYIYQTIQEDWAIGVDTGAYDCSVFARIKYVHELQHALKICGIDKKIVV